MQNDRSKTKSDLKERAYRFSLKLIAFVNTLPNKPASRIIINQLIRSATSIGANLVEARASSSRLEFKKFHEIVLKSANETKYWLGLLKDSHLADREATNTFLVEVGELARMVASGILKLKGKKL